MKPIKKAAKNIFNKCIQHKQISYMKDSKRVWRIFGQMNRNNLTMTNQMLKNVDFQKNSHLKQNRPFQKLGIFTLIKSKSMSVTFQVESYLVTCSLIGGQLTFRLEPADLSNSAINHYIYQSQFTESTFPEGLRFVFLEGVEGWFKYISYFKEKCMLLDIAIIRKDEDSEMVGEISYGEIPLYFRMSVLEGLRESKLRLSGSRQPYSKEERLEKLILTKENIIQDLGRKILDKEAIIEERDLTIQKKDAEIQRLKKQLAERDSRILELQQVSSKQSYREMPRKKVHIEDSIQSQQENEQNQSQNPNQTNPINSRNILNNSIQIIEEHKVNFTFNEPTFFNHTKKLLNSQIQNQQQQNQRKGLIPIFEEQSKQQRQQIQESNQGINKDNSRQSKSIPINEGRKEIEPQKLVDQVRNAEERQHSQQFVEQNPEANHSNFIQQRINPSSGLYQDKHLMVRQFSQKRCLMEVGFDEKGTKKYGFSCMFCEKIFKEDEFLFKHLTTRHPNYVNNDTTIEFLTQKWSDFKIRREQKVAIAEANMVKDKRSERLDNAITRLTMK